MLKRIPHLILLFILSTFCLHSYCVTNYAVTGGVVSGTQAWVTSPPASCIFQEESTNMWVLDFKFGNSEFKVLSKENGQAGEEWGWGSERKDVKAGVNVSGGNGNNISLQNFNVGEDVHLILTFDPSQNCYFLTALKSGISITPSQPNPINKGSFVALTAENVSSVCTWECSINSGITWSPFPDAPSGTLNQTILVSPTEDTQYKVTSGGKSSVYEVIINNLRFAVTGGVVSGTQAWNTSPTEECIFKEDGVDRWSLDFIYEQSAFKVLSKNGGRAGEDWGWGAQLNEIDGVAPVSGGNGGDMSISGFSSGDAVKLILTKEDSRYKLTAEAGNYFKIVPSLPNPIVQGDELTLTASGADAPCTWDYSYDGISWTPFTGTISGSLNEIIAPTPIVGTYYRATDGVSTDIYHVNVIIKCSGRSQTHLQESFGTLSSSTARNRDSHVPSTYVFSAEGKEVHDGFYAVVANPINCGRGNRTTPGDCHSESCIGNVNSSGDYWYVDRTDHTGDTNGGMLLLNCNNKGEVMYSYTQTGLCKNIYMTFSAWFASASSGIPIKTRFMVLDKSGNEIVSARFDVDAISKDEGWKQGQTAFFSGDNDQLTVQIINNGSSGNGNDILVDDIAFTSCIPKLEIKPELDVICGESARLTVESDGIELIFGTAPYYLWQIYNSEAPDPLNPWEDIPEDPVAGRESHGGSGWDKVQYDYATVYKEVKPQFRVIMSADPDVARQVGHGIFPVCNVYAETEIAIVDCGCAPQTVEHLSGEKEQTLCSGDDIEEVKYKASGVKTNSIGVKNLPTGMVSDISGTNLTIKGKAPSVEEERDVKVKVFAKGVEGVACASDTLELDLKIYPSPDAPNVVY